MDLSVLIQFEEFIEFRGRSRRIGRAEPGAPGDSEATPRETVAAAVEEANAAVAAEVLDRVRERMLARLMVDLNIGVQDRERYVIKRIDEDFFEDVG